MFGGNFGGAGGYGGYGGGFGGSGTAAPAGGGYGGAGAEGVNGGYVPAGGDPMANSGYGGGATSQGLGGWVHHGGMAQGEQPHGAPAQQQRQTQTLTPVTIHMLNDAVKQQKSNAGQLGGLDAAFTVNGRELGMLTLVACVESVQQQPTYKAFSVSDGTGRIFVQYYGDSDLSSGAREIRPGDYVRIFGHLRAWQGQEGVNAHQVAVVESANEISYHTIEVAHVHLSITGKLLKPAAPAPIAATAQQPSMASFPGIPGSAGMAQSVAAPGMGAYQQAGGMQFQQQATAMQSPSGQFAAPLFGGAQGAPAPAPAAQFAGTAPAPVGPYAMYGAGSAVAGGLGGAAPGGPYGAAPAPGSSAPPAGNPYGGPYGGGAPPGGPGSNLF